MPAGTPKQNKLEGWLLFQAKKWGTPTFRCLRYRSNRLYFSIKPKNVQDCPNLDTIGCMAHLTGPAKSRYVQDLFTRIAHRYDLMNRLMTAGQDIRWRREVIRRAALHPQAWLLDLGAGTGDLAREALVQQPTARVIAADFTLEMMRAGRRPADRFAWSAADALCLPFGTEQFDAVVSGFLMRNVIDTMAALREQYRVLKPRGRVVILDTTRPRKNVLWPLIWLHLHVIIPGLGMLISGHRDAYTYLPDSTEAFLSAENLAARMAAAGFKQIGYKRLMFGTISIHWGEK
ncbi:MAG: ubiquinone biosynthesis protein UbiE [Anaerolineae bacterium]|nr:MAG: ubiquinone biosynthesis protein UbiE [Anaerolineae bacterium]